MSSLTGRRRSPQRTSLAAAVLLATSAWTLHGCDASDSVPLEAASECYWGAQFADCGGNGTPRLACPPGELGCLWFTGGVVAEGYLAWPCADGRICCEDGPDASYPHDLYFSPASFFNLNGPEPWTRERSLDLAVTIDSELAGELAVHCERDGNVVEDIAPCRVPNTGSTESMNRYFWHAAMRDTLSVAVGQTDGFVSYRVLVEIVPRDASEPLLARACLLRESDGIAVSCDPEDYLSPQCATEGSVRLTAVPTRNESDLSGVVVAGDVVFPSGLEVSFTVPL